MHLLSLSGARRKFICPLFCSLFCLIIWTASAEAQFDAFGGDEDKEQSDEDKPDIALIEADQLTYDTENEIVVAIGNVEIVYDERTLMADKVTYNQKTDTIVADGNVSLTEATGEVFFAEHAELKDELKEGVIGAIRVLLADDSLMAANQGTRRAGRQSILNKVVYSPCKVCEDGSPPLWQVKAYRAIHDTEKKEIEYQDAFLELFGVPVAYTPYLNHPDPSVKRKSGILAPTIGNETELGNVVEIPVYLALSDNYDATLTPVYTSKEGLLLKGEFRHRTQHGQYKFDGSITRPDERDDLNQLTGGKDLRGHIFGRGEFRVNDPWRWGFQVEQVSDDTYLQRYDIPNSNRPGFSNTDRLENELFIERIKGRNHATARAFAFKDLRQSDPGQTPVVLPLLDAKHIFDDPIAGGQTSVEGNFLSLFRSDGTDVTRLSGTAKWERPVTTKNGQVIKGFASLRADGYFSNDLNPTSDPLGPKDSQVLGRILPVVGADWRWPFIRPGRNFNLVIEPIAQLVYTPVGGNPDGISNEDSTGFEFDETNLFTVNKFPGLDRWEDGPRVNYGLRWAAMDDKDGFAEIMIGQSYRFVDNDTFAAGSGLETQRSDYVGRVVIGPSEHFNLIHRFRLDRNDFSIERNEIEANANYWRVGMNVNYLKTSADATDVELVDREEFISAGYVDITDRWRLSGLLQRNLQTNTNVYAQLGLTYQDECTWLNIIYRKDFTSDRDVQSSNSILVTFKLTNLG